MAICELIYVDALAYVKDLEREGRVAYHPAHDIQELVKELTHEARWVLHLRMRSPRWIIRRVVVGLKLKRRWF